MKKTLSCIIIIFLLLFPVSSVADDFSDLAATFEESSFDELMAINAILQQYLQKKAITGSSGVQLEPGMYEVGIDIPSGNYYFEGVRGRLPVSIHVYPSINQTHALDAIQECFNIGYDSYGNYKSGKFILKDGWIVEIVQGPAIIHVFTGLFN